MASHFETRLRELLGDRARATWNFGAPSSHPEYNVWKKMRNRCNNPRNGDYAYYGGRGIKVCPQWDSFAQFITDMSTRPTPDHTIERINNDGDYEPANCRWATRAEQNRSKRPGGFAKRAHSAA